MSRDPNGAWGAYVTQHLGELVGSHTIDQARLQQIKELCESVVKYENRNAVDLSRVILSILDGEKS